MSHPDPRYDYSDESKEGETPSKRMKNPHLHNFKSEMKEIRSGLQKVVGHTRRERHSKAKGEALKKKKM